MTHYDSENGVKLFDIVDIITVSDIDNIKNQISVSRDILQTQISNINLLIADLQAL